MLGIPIFKIRLLTLQINGGQLPICDSFFTNGLKAYRQFRLLLKSEALALHPSFPSSWGTPYHYKSIKALGI